MKFSALLLVLLCIPAWAQNTVTVRVTNAQKVPLADAQVAMRIWGEKKWRQESLKTDADGKLSFDVAAVPDPKKPVGSVTVHAAGFALQGRNINSAQMDLIMQPGAVWRGKVSDEAGVPVAGALVNIRAFLPKKGGAANDYLFPFGDAMEAAYSAHSGADGTFEIADIPPDSTLSYGVSAHYRASTEGLGVRADVLAKAVLTPGGALAGQVLGLDGQPLAKLHVIAANSGDPNSGAGEATSDAQGKFIVDSLAPGNYDISADAISKDYLVPNVKNVAVQAGKTLETPVMRAVKGQLVSGIVRDKDSNKPLEGAQIAGVFGPDTNGSVSGVSDSTEADGRFSLRVLPGQNTFYLFQTPDSYLGNGVKQTLDISDKTSDIVFDLQKKPTLTGTVVNEKNQPIPAQLRLWGGPDDVINSDAQGKWSYQPNSLNPIQIGGGDGENGYFEVLSDWKLPVPSPKPITVKVRLIPWQHLSGRVLATDGKPLAGVEVKTQFFFPIGDDGALGDTTRTAKTDADGRYQFDKIRAGDNPGEMARDLKITVKADKLSFVEGGEITSDGANWKASDIVLSALNLQIEGTTAPGARLTAAGQSAVADAQGKFRFADLPSGAVTVYAALNGNFGSATSTGEAPINIEFAPMQAQGVDVKLGRDAWREVFNESDDKFYARDWTLARLNSVDGDTFVALQQSAKEPPTPNHDSSLAAQLAKWAPKIPTPNRVAQIESVTSGIQDRETRLTAWLDAALAVPKDADLNKRALSEVGDVFEQTFVDPRWREGTLYRLAVVTERVQGAKAGVAALDKAMAVTLKIHDPKTVQTEGFVQPGRDGYLAMYAEIVAQGSPALLRHLLVNISPEKGDRVAALGAAIPVIARERGVEAALPLLEELRALPKPEFAPGEFHFSKNEPDYAFDMAARRIVPLLAAKDAARALELARRIGDNDGRARALASVAPFEAPAVAASLWRESVTSGDVGDAPRFAAQAFDHNEKLGRELFALARTRGANSTTYNRGGFWAPYGFYLARADAATARLELERQWSQNLAGNEGQNLAPIAMAMSAADGSRALEMARQIPRGKDNFWSLEACRKIGQYLVASEAQRRDWPFDRWGATDTWQPGDEEW